MAGDSRERGQKRERLKLCYIAVRCAAQNFEIVASCSCTIGKKQQIEFGCFCQRGNVAVIVEIDTSICNSIRMPPCRNMVADRIDEQAKTQKTLTLCHFRRSGPEMVLQRIRLAVPDWRGSQNRYNPYRSATGVEARGSDHLEANLPDRDYQCRAA